MDAFISSETLLSFFTLAFLETILGIDNLIFIQIVSSKVAPLYQKQVRKIGLVCALLLRLIMLVSISHLVALTYPILFISGLEISWRDIILLGGGLLLLTKGTMEIHHDIEGRTNHKKKNSYMPYGLAILQIAVLDVVFSLDSIITAVGMTTHLPVMIAAVVFAMGIMIFAAEWISTFVQRYRTIKMLALAFLILIGLTLIAEAFDFHIPKEYLYFAILFSISVEFLNIVTRKFLKRDDEVRNLLQEGTKMGDFNKTEESMIKGVMRLGDKPIKSFMSSRHNLEWIDLSVSPQELLSNISSYKSSRLLVCKGNLDETVGIIYLKDLMEKLISSSTFSLKKLVKRPAYVPSTMQALEVLEHFNQTKINLVVVVDELGAIEGVVTASDILTAITGGLKEQNLKEHISFIEKEDGSWLFNGEVLMEEVVNIMKLCPSLLGKGHYRTVAGFILYSLRRIPCEGQRFICDNHCFKVIDLDGNKISKVLISKL